MKLNRHSALTCEWEALGSENHLAQPLDQPPILYKLAKRLIRNNIRGSFRLLLALKKVGLLDRPVNFSLSDTIRIEVPIARTPLDEFDLSQYEATYLKTLGGIISSLPEPVTLIDGGADIGLFSLKTIAICPTIRQVLGFEPNSAGFRWLQRNFSKLRFPAQAIPKALSDFEGRGNLEAPSSETKPNMESKDKKKSLRERQAAYMATDHAAQYLVPAINGPIPVTTIDSMSLPSGASLIIKLDIEGGELAALRGSARTIQSASNVVIAIEAHPLVAKRTGNDPVDCLQYLNSLRRFSFVAAETQEAVDISRPVFGQLPLGIYNIIASSKGD